MIEVYEVEENELNDSINDNETCNIKVEETLFVDSERIAIAKNADRTYKTLPSSSMAPNVQQEIEMNKKSSHEKCQELATLLTKANIWANNKFYRKYENPRKAKKITEDK